jgi:crotonobetainyl-CoA:carnitine CoA-transferase CaiB-like acyl-CoA transferase
MPYRFTGYEWQARRPAPLLGEHTESVLADIAGLEARQIAALGLAGVT